MATDLGSWARLFLRLQAQRAFLWTLGGVLRDPSAQTFLPWGRRNPYPLYERIRAQGSLVPTRFNAHVSVSHSVVGDLLRSRGSSVAAGDQRDFGIDLSLLELDPPDHTRLRRLVMPAFSPRRIKGLEQTITAGVHDLLDRAEAQREFDLVTALAAPLPTTVITALLGIGSDDHEPFLRYGTAIAGALDGIQSLRHARELRIAEQELGTIFSRLLVERRDDPRQDVISDLAAVDQDRATHTELLSLCTLLLVAGFETTVNLIGSTVLNLHRHDQWPLVVEDPTLAEAAIEETLRFDPPVQVTGRLTTTEMELGGHTVPAGTSVVALLGGTGRDPEVFDRADEFDLTRPHQSDHLAFSAGVHYCLGAPLARLEARIAVAELARRMPRLASTGPVRMRPTTTLRGPAHLGVRIVD